MSFALSSGVSGLQAHQKMLDVAGNNLANVNSTAFKASRINFAELLSQTLKKATQPTSTIGGTNPQQIGSGVGVAGITPDMSQGNIVNTGSPLDLAIEGGGYFVLSDGQQYLYTRVGAFSADEENMLVDPATGYRLQRVGSMGESDGFQQPTNSNIHLPYDVTLPAKATSEIVLSGNLSSDATLEGPQTQNLSSNVAYTYNSGTVAASDTEFDELEQFSGTLTSGTITIAGYNKDGSALSSGLTFDIDGSTTLGDLVDHLNNNVLTDATASLVNGKIVVTDKTSGYSKTDISMSYSGDGELTMPGYFELLSVGGDEVKSANRTVFDSLGGMHTLSGAFVRTNTGNTWDLVLASITGDVNQINIDDRWVNGITFSPSDGSYLGLTGSGSTQFKITFEHDPANEQTIDLFLGTVGKLDGLTQYSGDSTAVVRDQDGYSSGRLSSVSVSNEGVVVGAFSNGIKKNMATLQIALFQNASGLDNMGNGYFVPSSNSGDAVATQAMSGGAGTIHGGALEKSNADVATEFVNLIQAQNGYQANARTIRVATDILAELSNLIK
jgi:flagellar hook protein FlgE